MRDRRASAQQHRERFPNPVTSRSCRAYMTTKPPALRMLPSRRKLRLHFAAIDPIWNDDDSIRRNSFAFQTTRHIRAQHDDRIGIATGELVTPSQGTRAGPVPQTARRLGDIGIQVLAVKNEGAPFNAFQPSHPTTRATADRSRRRSHRRVHAAQRSRPESSKCRD